MEESTRSSLNGKEHMNKEVVKDIDGNEYSTANIGGQVWMAENLRSLHFVNGTEIDGVFTYKNDERNGKEFGRIYSWEVIAHTHDICPQGWHVPTDEDWKKLESFLGMAQSEVEKTGWRGTKSEGIKIKKHEKDFLWIDYSRRGVNESGFSALPGGAMMPAGLFIGKGLYTDFWTSTECSEKKAYIRSLVWLGFHPGKSKIYRSPVTKKCGFYVRCVKDQNR